MKRYLFLLMSVILIAGYSCGVDNAKVVETQKQTLSCLPGEWEAESKDSDLYVLNFEGEGTEKSGRLSAQSPTETLSASWSYSAVGEVELHQAQGLSSFKLLNCKKGILNGEIIYIKK